MPNTTELPKIAEMSTNGEIGIFLDTTPSSETPTWGDMREIFENDTYAMNETIMKLAFLSDSGFGSSWVSGADPTVSLNGRFFKNNALCQYFSGIEHKIGKHRITRYKIEKFGKTITGTCTIQNLNIGGGTGADGAPIAITIGFNGEPTVENTPESGGT